MSIFKTLFDKQKEVLEHFFSHVDCAACEKVFHALKQTKGTIFFTGVGKSGYIAQKIASTLMSTGTRAHFLSPLDALHGDLGMVLREDILVLMSKSGESEEILQLLPPLRNKGAQLIAITSNAHSRLAKSADLSLELPCLSELCPFDLAPTTSAEIQLIFGDALAIALMEAKNFSLDAYAANHPAGRIGRRVNLKVRDLMLDKTYSPVCYPHQLLEEVLVDFTNKRCGCLIVVDEKERLKGIFTDGDLRRALQQKGEKVLKESLSSLMTPYPKSIEINALAWDALKVMESDQKRPVTILPVIDNEKVAGVIKMHDLIQAGI